jgi:hypothetical protein
MPVPTLLFGKNKFLAKFSHSNTTRLRWKNHELEASLDYLGRSFSKLEQNNKKQ